MSDKQLKIRIKFHAPSKTLLESTPTLDTLEQEHEPVHASKNKRSLKLISVAAGFTVLAIAIFIYMLNDHETPQATIADIGSGAIIPGAADDTSGDFSGSSIPSLRLFDPAETAHGSMTDTKDTSGADEADLLAKAQAALPTPPPQISLPVLVETTNGSLPSNDNTAGIKTSPDATGLTSEAMPTVPSVPADEALVDIAEIETDSPAQPQQSLPSGSTVLTSDVSSDGGLYATDSNKPSNAISNRAAHAEPIPLGERDEPIQLPDNIARAQFTTGIEAREPIDRIESVVFTEGQQLKRLFYFTELRDLKGETIIHRWEHEGEVVAEVKFNVRGNRWRVYSSKYLSPQMTGQWRVIVVNSKGESLISTDFMFESS
jgi:Protein of unknown function (DUF2914)